MGGIAIKPLIFEPGKAFIQKDSQVPFGKKGEWGWREKTINDVFDFAWNMSFGERGEHRPNRSGGENKRTPGEIFANAFQGKLAEFGLQIKLNTMGLKCSTPDLNCYERGKWDSGDLKYQDRNGRWCLVSIKSVAKFSNLLLLETKDWDKTGLYRYGNVTYDNTVLVRVSPDCKKLLKENNLLKSKTENKNQLYNLVKRNRWSFDIPGWISREDLVEIIQKKMIIHKGVELNGYMRMDADNYYIHSGDLRNISTF